MSTTINPRIETSQFHLDTRQFHIDIEANNKIIWNIDISIEVDSMHALSSQKSLKEALSKGKIEEKSQWQREYDVIRSIAERAYLQKSQVKGCSHTLSVVITSSGKMVVNKGEFEDFDVSPTRGQSAIAAENIAERGYKNIRIVETTDHKTMIEQFVLHPKFTGAGASLKKFLHPIFIALGEKFKSIDRWWKKIVGLSMEMPWNMAVLGESIGLGTRTEKVPLRDGLRYISSLTAGVSPALSNTLSSSSDIANDLEELRRKNQKQRQEIDALKAKPIDGTPADAQKLQKASDAATSKKNRSLIKGLDTIKQKVMNDIANLTHIRPSNEVVFVPLALSNGTELLLKVSRHIGNSYNLEIIDPSDTFSKRIEENIFKEIPEKELEKILDRALTISVDHETDMDTLLNDMTALLANAPKKEKAAEAVKPNVSGVSLVAETVAKMFTGKGSEYHDLALRIRLFTDMCHASENWLQDPTYRREVQKNCYILLNECNDFFASEKIPPGHAQRELIDVRNEIEKILAKTEAVLPKITEITEVSLPSLGSDKFPVLPPTMPAKIDKLTTQPIVPDPALKQMVVNAAANMDQIDAGQLAAMKVAFGAKTNSELYGMPPGLVAEMSKKLTWMNYQFQDYLTDADVMKKGIRDAFFPALTSGTLGLTNGEMIDLTYTLHSLDHLAGDLRAAFPTKLNASEKLARAHYTFQALLKHPKLGRSPQIQGWLTQQLFSEGRIETLLATLEGRKALNAYLKTFNNLATELMDVRPESTSFAKNYSSGLFLLSLVNQIALHVKNTSPGSYDEVFKEVEVGTRDLPARVNARAGGTSDAAKAIQGKLVPAYLGMVYDNISQSDPLPDITDQLGTMLAAYRCIADADIDNPALKSKVQGLRPYIYALAAKHLAKGNHAFVDSYLNIIGKSTLIPPGSAWTIAKAPSSFPILETTTPQGVVVQLDLVTGEVYSGGARADRLPKEVAEDPNVRRIFPDATQRLWKVQKPQIDSAEPEAAALQNVIVYSSTEIDPADPAKTATIPIRIVVDTTRNTVTDESGQPKLVLKFPPRIEREVEFAHGQKEWAVYNYFPAQEALAKNQAPGSTPQDLSATVASAIGFRTCWQNRDGNRIHIFESCRNTRYGTFGNFVDQSGKTFSQLTLANGSTMLEPLDKGLFHFSTVEDPRHIIVFGTRGVANQIEYSRLRMAGTNETLSYNIAARENGAAVIGSSQFPDWQLAPVGKMPGILRKDILGNTLPPALPAGFVSYQLLEKRGQQKVLVVGKKLEIARGKPNIKGAFETILEEGDPFKPSKVYDYNVDPETNRLKSTSAEANLHMAYVSLVHKDFTAALYYADKARTGIGDTEGFTQIFQWVQEWNDDSPGGIATKLKLLCLAERVHQQEIMIEKQKHKVPTKLVSKIPEISYEEQIQELYARYSSFSLHNSIPQGLALTSKDNDLLRSLGITVEKTTDQEQVAKNIANLKAELGSTEEVSGKSHVPIKTNPDHTSEVAGKDFFNIIKKLFTVSPAESTKVVLDFFDKLAKDKGGTTARVAKIHKADTEEALAQEPTTAAAISQKNTKVLITDFEARKKEVTSSKEKYIRNALNALEGVGKAGTVAIGRDLGLEERTTIDSLMQIWRSGDMLDPAQGERVNKLAGRRLGPEDIAELDRIITYYMAAVTDLNHIDNVIKAAKDYLNSCGENEYGNKNLAQDLFTLASTKRAYTLYTPRNDLPIQELLKMADKNPIVLSEAIDRLKMSEEAEGGRAHNESLGYLKSAFKRFTRTEPSHKEASLQEILANPAYSAILTSIRDDTRMLRRICQDANDADYRDLLSIEYSTGFILRSNQVDTLREMLSNPNAVRQLGMGGGKSKVLLPLLAKRKCTGRNLVPILLPEALYETNRRDLDKTNRELFGQDFFCFEYNKNSDLNSKDLNKMHEQLLTSIKGNGFIAFRKSDLQSFRNAYISKIKAVKEGKVVAENLAEMVAQIKAMADILTTFKKRMDIIADEVDSILDVRKELNFAEGDPIPVDPIKTDVGLEFMEFVFKAKEGEPLYRLQKALVENTQALIASNDRAEMLKIIAGKFWDQHVASGQTLGDRDAFIAYVTTGGGLTKTPEFMQQLGKRQFEGEEIAYKQVAALKAFITRGFGTTLGKTSKVDYGRELDPEKPFTIPYKASNTPSIGSEFDDDIERISFTLQDYCSQPVDKALVFRCVANLSKQMDDEFKKGKREIGTKFRVQDTEAFKQFAAIVNRMDPPDEHGNTKITRDLSIAIEDENSVVLLTGLINSSPQARMTFCKAYTLDMRMKLYPEQVTSNAEDMVDMVHGFGGFTGTPWNTLTYHDKIDAQRNLGVDGRTYALLLKYQPPVRTIDYNPRDPSASLVNLDPKYRIVVDAGALLHGVDNAEFMRRLMGDKPENEDVGFYFDDSGKMVARKADCSIVPADQIPAENLKNRLMLFDQSHTVGADQKFDKKVVAGITIGKDTSTRDLFQAIWRLRQFHLEQRIEFLITDEMKRLILGDKYGTREPTVEDILAYCVIQESTREADDNYRAEGNKIRGTGSRTMFDQLVELGTKLDTHIVEGSILALKKLSSLYMPNLIKKRAEEESYDQAAAVTASVPPVDVLERLRHAEAKRLIDVGSYMIRTNLFENHARGLIAKAQELDGRPNKPADIFPKTIDVNAAAAGNEVQAEVQQEVAVAIQLQQVVEEQEEVVEAQIPPAAEAGGKTEMVLAGTIHHNDITNFSQTPRAQQDDIGIGDATKVRSLHHHIGCFDPRLFIGILYEGRLKKDKANAHQAADFGHIGENGHETTTERASPILHSERLPINEALFVKDPVQGWRVIFGNTHDAYPSFTNYPASAPTGTGAALVMIGSRGPVVTVSKNDDFDRALETEKEQFYQLYVQLKFLRGDVNYDNKNEIDALKAWLQGGGTQDQQKQHIADMRYLFEKVILGTKSAQDQRDTAYSQSQLRNIFDEMQAPVAIAAA